MNSIFKSFPLAIYIAINCRVFERRKGTFHMFYRGRSEFNRLRLFTQEKLYEFY